MPNDFKAFPSLFDWIRKHFYFPWLAGEGMKSGLQYLMLFFWGTMVNTFNGYEK